MWNLFCWVGWYDSLPTVQKLLAACQDKRMVEEVWRHMEGEFNRITETGLGLLKVSPFYLYEEIQRKLFGAAKD